MREHPQLVPLTREWLRRFEPLHQRFKRRREFATYGITARAGRIECDANGFPTHIDLLRDLEEKR